MLFGNTLHTHQHQHFQPDTKEPEPKKTFEDARWRRRGKRVAEQQRQVCSGEVVLGRQPEL